MDQRVQAIQQPGDVFLVGWQGEDYREVFWQARELGDIAGDDCDVLVPCGSLHLRAYSAMARTLRRPMVIVEDGG